MEDILEVEYRIRATVYVLDELEKSYSEETDFKRKISAVGFQRGIKFDSE